MTSFPGSAKVQAEFWKNIPGTNELVPQTPGRRMRTTVSLQKSLTNASFVGCGDIAVSRVVTDSRRIQPGDTFVALPGSRVDGNTFIADAVARGATSVIRETVVPCVAVPCCIVPNARSAFARLTTLLAGRPERWMNIAAVTGTNGKTTVSWMLRSILEAADCRAGLLGTIEYSDGVTSKPSTLTTPDAIEIADWMLRMQLSGASHLVLEASSHALDQCRLDGLRLDAAAVTNVTHDHLDYHGSFEDYIAAKARIAERLHPDAPLVLAIDAPGTRELARRLSSRTRTVTVGFSKSAELHVGITGTHRSDNAAPEQSLTLELSQGSIPVVTALIGRHNALNCLIAAAMAEQMGICGDAIAEGLRRLHCVPGRMELINCGQTFSVLVDYAHTPDALRTAVTTAREISRGRVICVMGAGGDRDREKRPLMGQAVSASDVIVVTSDNPRGEPPEAIIEQIVSGIESGPTVVVNADRAGAIQQAVSIATSGDVVLIAGKGHEQTQTIGKESLSFDDRAVARQALLQIGAAPLERSA